MKKLHVAVAVCTVCLAASLGLALAGCAVTEEQVSYTLTFWSEGERYAETTAKENTTVVLSEIVGTPTSGSGEFEGWSLAEGGDIVTEYRVLSDASFYAVFSTGGPQGPQGPEGPQTPEKQSYTVTFVAVIDGVEQEISTQQVEANGMAVAPDAERIPEMEGHSFTGWDKDPAKTPITARTKFTAVYQKNAYTLSVNVLGDVEESEVLYGDPIALSAPALPEAVVFEGWHIGAQDGAAIQNGAPMPASDLTVYAKCRLDLEGAALIEPQDPVYGKENTVAVQGLKSPQEVTYTYAWQKDGAPFGTAESISLAHAGEYAYSVTVSAEYRGLTAQTTLSGRATVARRPLSATLSLTKATVTYGERPVPKLEFMGLLKDDAAPNATYSLQDSTLTLDGKLPVGQYTVCATAEASSDYELAPIAPVTLKVERATLTASLTAEDIVYGNMPAPHLTLSGFQWDETEAVLTERENAFVYTKGGAPYTEPRFTQGEYGVTLREGAYAGENYTFTAPSATFSVTQARITITVSVKEKALTYGETPKATVTCGKFAFEDENAETVFGALAVQYRKGEEVAMDFHVGHYTATTSAENANYQVTIIGDSFEISPKALQVHLSLEKNSIVYGEQTPNATISYEGFLEGEEGLGAAKAVFYRGEQELGEAPASLAAGSYAVRIQWDAALPDYEIQKDNEMSLTVTPKGLTLTLPKATAVYADGIAFAPQVEGLLEADASLEEEILEGLRYSVEESELLKKEGGYFPAEGYLAAGDHTVKVILTKALSNYTMSEGEGQISISKRPFEIAATASNPRKSGWSMEPALPEQEGEIFEIAGSLKLLAEDAKTYVWKGDTLSGDFTWETPLKITLKGEDVTSNFAVTYNLNITLDASVFGIEVPKAGHTYDGTEHEYTITVTTEEEGVEPVITYAVDSDDYSAETPKLRDAKEYVIKYKVTAANFEEKSGQFTVTVAQAEYAVQGATDTAAVPYDGAAHGTRPTVQGVAGDDVANLISFTFSYRPYFGSGKTVSDWNDITDAGVYTVSYTVSGNPNYRDASGSFTVTISRIRYTVTGTEKQTYTYFPAELHGTGIEVETLDRSNPAVTYSEGEYSGSTPPTFEHAKVYTVHYTVAEGVNYEAASGTYTVEIQKATVQIDPAGVGGTLGNFKEASYADEVSTRLRSVKVKIGGRETEIGFTTSVTATLPSGGNMDGAESYLHAGNYTVTLTALGTDDYEGTSEEVHFTIGKGTRTGLPEGATAPAFTDVLAKRGGTLSALTFADERFRWKSSTEEVKGGGAFYAIFTDGEDYEDFEVQISVSTRKATVTLTFRDGEADFAQGADYSADYTGYSVSISDGIEDDLEELQVTHGAMNYTVGSTYLVTWTVNFTENAYFKVQLGEEAQDSILNGTATTLFKVKSVEYGGKLYTVEDALKEAKSGTVTVKHNTAFMAKADRDPLGDRDPYADAACYTVAEGVTLLVPYKDGDTGDWTSNVTKNADNGGRVAKCKLIVSEGIVVTVNGKLIISGSLLTSSDNKTSSINGSLYAEMELKENAKIVVKNGADYSSIGYTYGLGTIVAESGSTVHEPFNMTGWKGGTRAKGAYSETFPINQYTLASIESKLEIQSGAEYILNATVTASIIGTQNVTVTFISNSDKAFLQLNSGSVTKWIGNETTSSCQDKVHLAVNGSATFHHLSLSLGYVGSFSSSGFILPIPGNFDIKVESGTTTIPESVALRMLPGATLTVAKGAKVDIANGASLYAYGSNNVTFEAGSGKTQWEDKYLSYPSNKEAYRNTSAASDYTTATPAKIIVEGELTVESGATLGTEITGKQGAKLVVAEGATLEVSAESKKIAELKEVTGNQFSAKGSFYYVGMKAMFAGSETVITAGKTYTYSGSDWAEGLR